MNPQDIKQLTQIIRTEIGNALEQVVLPEFAEIKNDIAILKTDVAQLKTDVAELKTDVALLKRDMIDVKEDIAELKTDVGVIKTRYPDKAYLDDKIAELRGDILQGRKQDSARVDKHIALNRMHGALTDEDVKTLEEMRPFAPLPG